MCSSCFCQLSEASPQQTAYGSVVYRTASVRMEDTTKAVCNSAGDVIRNRRALSDAFQSSSRDETQHVVHSLKQLKSSASGHQGAFPSATTLLNALLVLIF